MSNCMSIVFYINMIVSISCIMHNIMCSNVWVMRIYRLNCSKEKVYTLVYGCLQAFTQAFISSLIFSCNTCMSFIKFGIIEYVWFHIIEGELS